MTRTRKPFPIGLISAFALTTLLGFEVTAQEEDTGTGPGVPQIDPDPAATEAEQQREIEEVVVVGRLLSAAESLTDERIELPFSADFLGAEVIARAGDSNIGAALRRVPGITLVDGKFVYVRGLGERYSSVTVNGAAVPSPDLTRSVIPLDLFPTSIVESIKIQKSPSPDQPAAFGGGAIVIRTTSIPEGPVVSLSGSLGFNDQATTEGLSYGGGSGALPQAIRAAIDTYRGDISVSNIFSTLNFGGNATLAEAQAIHQGLIDSLDTNVGITPSSLDPDYGLKLALGNSWYIGDDWRFGVLGNFTYDEKFRNEDQRREGVGAPEDIFRDIQTTVEEERTVGSLNVGVGFGDDHSVEASYYVLQNDEDEASISRGFDQNNEFPDQKTAFSTRLEERELTLTQFSGSHRFTDTPVLGNFLDAVNLRELEVDWFYSESEATTDIPNESDFQGSAIVTEDGGIVSQQILATTSSGQFSFLELEDELNSWGGDIALPLDLGPTRLKLKGGWWGSKKNRQYYGYNLNLNSVGVSSSILGGTPGDVLGSGSVTIANGFDLSLGSQFGTESYIAAQKVNAAYGMIDAELGDNWRVTLGARYEDYQQAVLPIDLLDYTGVSLTNLINELSSPNQTLTIQQDDTFASIGLTYLSAGLLGSDEYQIRLSYGETTVRPDLREIADVVFIDPEIDIRVQGNPILQSSPIDNFEIRSEFYYGNGDNFTVSVFYKDIEAPIERIRSAGSDDDVVLGFANAESGEIYGVEFEGLKTLWGGLFLQGNVTLSDSELTFGTNLATALTNRTRRLTGHSEWVVNATLGYDSSNGKHSAFLNYNAFGDRIFFAGTGQNDDAFEQPFHSLGIVYRYYPTEKIEISAKLDNILDENQEFDQVGATGSAARIVNQDVGRSFSVGAKWAF